MSLKNFFNSLGKKEYDFANGNKTAHVTTNKTLFTSSYTVETKEDTGNGSCTATYSQFSVGRNVTAKGVQKGKDFCGIT
jgi:hypothetical protein